MATEYHYLRADEIKIGDILPDVSRTPIVAIGRTPDDAGHPVTFTFANMFTRTARHGGPGYGYESFRVERPVTESEEDYARACDAQHAANPHRFEGEL